MGRLETDTLAMPENRSALGDLNGQWIDRFHDRNGLKPIVPDMDSSVSPTLSPTHGDQEGAAGHGHFDRICHHPNFLFNQPAMLERCAPRHGNVDSANGQTDGREVPDPVIARYVRRYPVRFFRADAAYAIPALHTRLEDADYFHAIRLPSNAVLREKIAHQMTRPVERPSLTKVTRLCEKFGYQAASLPGSNGIRAICSRGSALSSPAWRWSPTRWCGSHPCRAAHQEGKLRLALDAAVMQAVPP